MNKYKMIFCVFLLLTCYPYIAYSTPVPPWKLSADINKDGAVTISDVKAWCSWLYFLPGNSIIYLTIEELPEIAQFFELSTGNYNKFFSGFISFICWLLLIGLLSSLNND